LARPLLIRGVARFPARGFDMSPMDEQCSQRSFLLAKNLQRLAISLIEGLRSSPF